MAFTFESPSVRLVVTDQGASVAVPRWSPAARVFNSGLEDCRVDYSQPATADSPIVPAGLLEVHVKGSAGTLYARCETGKTTTLDIVCGTGD